MRYLHSFIIAALFAIALNTPAFAAVVTGTTGSPATRYDVTVTKIELCRSTACSNPFVMGTATKTFDIASASAGADVGNYISLKGIPLWQTWSHVRVTLSTVFTITGGDGTCQTDGSTTADRTTLATGTAGAGAGTPSVLRLPNENIANGPPTGYYAGIGFTAVNDAPTFSIVYALTTPYTCKGKMPRVEIKFDTSTAFGHDPGACNVVFPQPPTVTITASDP